MQQSFGSGVNVEDVNVGEGTVASSFLLTASSFKSWEVGK